MIHTPDGAISAGITSSLRATIASLPDQKRRRAACGHIVVQEIFGVHEHIRDICRRLALEGYLRYRAGALFPRRHFNDFADKHHIIERAGG